MTVVTKISQQHKETDNIWKCFKKGRCSLWKFWRARASISFVPSHVMIFDVKILGLKCSKCVSWAWFKNALFWWNRVPFFDRTVCPYYCSPLLLFFSRVSTILHVYIHAYIYKCIYIHTHIYTYMYIYIFYLFLFIYLFIYFCKKKYD